MEYRPLSARGKTGTSFDTLHEGIPPWLVEPLRAWVQPFLVDGGVYRLGWMRTLQARMHLQVTLPWGNTHQVVETIYSLLERGGGEMGLDVIDYALHFMREGPHSSARYAYVAHDLNVTLTAGGSAWEVTHLDAQTATYALTRRSVGPVREAIEELRPVAERAGAHLFEAWRHLAGRDPLPDQAYFQALLAVEAAGKPIISPRDGDATLGKMIRAIRDAPQKFAFVLGEVEAVLPVMEAMWTTHRRHGTDDREAPMGMSPEEADATVHLAITLVRWLTSGAFSRASLNKGEGT